MKIQNSILQFYSNQYLYASKSCPASESQAIFYRVRPWNTQPDWHSITTECAICLIYQTFCHFPNPFTSHKHKFSLCSISTALTASAILRFLGPSPKFMRITYFTMLRIYRIFVVFFSQFLHRIWFLYFLPVFYDDTNLYWKKALT